LTRYITRSRWQKPWQRPFYIAIGGTAGGNDEAYTHCHLPAK